MTLVQVLVDLDFDLWIEYEDSASTGGARYLIISYADSARYCNLMMKKDL